MRQFIAFLFFFSVCIQASSTDSVQVRVLSMNAWLNGSKVENGLGKLVSQIKNSQADIVLLQEADQVALSIAQILNWELISFQTSSAIISRFPVMDKFQFNNSVGAVLEIHGRKVGVVSVHLTAFPYGPYMACFENKSSDEILRIENALRAKEIVADLAQINLALPGEIPTIIGGDFNTPSDLDWAAENKDEHCGYAIEFPVTKILRANGFHDTYRILHPNFQIDKGYTWSPVEKWNHQFNAPEPQDRLDMIHARGSIAVESSEVFFAGPKDWPSDHAAVLSSLFL